MLNILLFSLLIEHYIQLSLPLAPGDLTDDSKPQFAKQFHQALACVCDELFISRCKPASKQTTLATLFKKIPTETEKHSAVEQLLDVKVKPDQDSTGKQFTAERRQERYVSEYQGIR